MRFRQLQSTWLDAVAYDPLTRTLTVRYRSGEMYRYLDVPHRVYEAFLIAESPGAYYNEFIRDRGYPSTPVRASAE